MRPKNRNWVYDDSHGLVQMPQNPKKLIFNMQNKTIKTLIK